MLTELGQMPQFSCLARRVFSWGNLLLYTLWREDRSCLLRWKLRSQISLSQVTCHLGVSKGRSSSGVLAHACVWGFESNRHRVC